MLTAARSLRKAAAAERLAARLVRRPNGCLEWTGYTNRDGYGTIKVNYMTILTHRFAWELANGRPVPAGKSILHSCDNPPCCEPSHLRPGTKADNAAECVSKGRNYEQKLTHCPQGHEYAGANLYIVPSNGNRKCRTCWGIHRRTYNGKAAQRANRVA